MEDKTHQKAHSRVHDFHRSQKIRAEGPAFDRMAGLFEMLGVYYRPDPLLVKEDIQAFEDSRCQLRAVTSRNISGQ